MCTQPKCMHKQVITHTVNFLTFKLYLTLSAHCQTVQICMAAKSVKTLEKLLVWLPEFEPLDPIKSGKPRRNAVNHNVAGSCAYAQSAPQHGKSKYFYHAILPSCVASEVVLLKLQLAKKEKRNEWCWKQENWTGQIVDTRWSQMTPAGDVR